MKNTNYLKEELYELIKTDESIFDFIQESSLDGLWYWDLEQPEEEWMNPKFWSVLGYDHREMPHKASAWKDIIHPEDLKVATENFIKHCENPDHPYDQTVRYTHKNGSTVWIRCHGMAIRDKHGKPLRMLGAHHNITELKNNELLLEKNTDLLPNAGLMGVTQDITDKKNLELEKEVLIKRLNYALDASGDGIWDWTPADGKTIYSKAWIEMLGYEVGELASLASEWSDRLHPDDAEWVFAAINKVTQTPENGDTLSHEYRFRNKAGDYLWMLNKAKVVERNEKGEASRVVGTHTNITERKRAENQVQASAQYLNSIINSIASPIFVKNNKHQFCLANEALCSLLNLPHEKIIGTTGFEYLPKEQMEIFIAKDQEVFGTGIENINEELLTDGTGKVCTIITRKTLYTDTEGNRFLVGTIIDITERKEAEIELARSTQLLEESQSIAKLGGWELDLLTGVLYWTAETYRIHDTSPEEFNPTVDAGVGYFLPESKRQISEALELAMTKGIGYDLYLETYTTKGRKIEVRTTCLVTVVDGKPTKLTGIFQDITEQKILELEKVTLIKRLNYALDASGEGIWDWIPADGKTIYSKAWLEMLGYEVGELTASTSEWSDRLHPDDAEWVFAAFNKLTQTPENGDTLSHEYRFRNKAGDYLWILNKAKVVERNEKGEASRVVGTHTNINERKKTEFILQESEKKFRGLFENLIDEVHLWKIIKDKNGKITGWQLVDANPAALKAWGKSINEVIGKTSNEIFEADAHAQFMPIVEEIFKTNTPYRWENYFSPTGQYLYMESIPFGDYFISTGKDITEQKKQEQILREKSEFLNLLGDHFPGMLGYWTKELRNTFANKKYANWFDKNNDEVIGLHMKELLGQELFKKNEPFINASLQGIAQQFEREIIKSDGEKCYTITQYVPHLVNDEVVGFFAIVTDVTEIKKAQIDVINANHFLEQVINTIGSPLFIKDIEHKYVKVNQALCSLLGQPGDRLIGKTGAEFSPPEEMEVFLAKDNEVLVSGIENINEEVLTDSEGNLRSIITHKTLYTDTVGRKFLVGVITDITEQKKSEQALKESELRLSLATQAGGVGVWDWDIVANRMTWDEQMFALYGLKREQFSNTYEAWYNRVYETDREWGNTEIELAIKGEKEFNTEFRVQTPNGQIRNIRALASVVRDIEGNAIRMIGTNWDITDEKEALKKIEEANQKLKSIFDGMQDVIWAVEAETFKTIFITPSAEDFYGYTIDEWYSNSQLWSEVIIDEYKYIIPQMFKNLEEEGFSQSEYKIKTKSGALKWVKNRVKVVKVNGVVARFEGVLIDITNEKEALKQIEEAKEQAEVSEHRLVIAQGVAKVGSWETDLQTLEVVWSEETYKIFGTDHLSFQASHPAFLEFIHPDDKEKVDKAFFESFTKTGINTVEHRIITVGNIVKYVEERWQIHSDLNGKPTRAVGTCQDITERKLAENELRLAKKQAEAANKAKSEFLANMSHEIRTPLNGVIGFTELLTKTPLNPVQQQYANSANVSGHTLLGIINDILDFSKIEAGMLELEIMKTDMVALLENSIDIVKFSAADKEFELLLDIDPAMPRFAHIDAIRTKQILANLLSNAVKFTQKGEVALKAVYQALDSQEGKLSISIRDTGIGISEEQKAKLFKSFSQADSSTTRKYGGTGLGLVISQMIAEKMGSKINIDSTPDVGTTFFFDIITHFEEGEKPDTTQIAGVKRCLIIDDNDNNRLILEQMLKQWQIESDSCNNGLEALKKLENSQPYDVVICDYDMPYLNGIDTIRLMKDKLKLSTEKQPVILLHSSLDNTELNQKSKELGIRFCLSKPVKSQDLFTYLSHLDQTTETIPQQETEQTVHVSQTSGKIKILIAEDNPLNMVLSKTMLSQLMPNSEVYEARNGLEAVEQYKSISPDLIFMDVHMPELDGIEATKKIREMEVTGNHLPIVALTAGALMEEKEKCLAAGMDDFLTKPLESTKIQTVLNKFFQQGKKVNADLQNIDAENEIHFGFSELAESIGNNMEMAQILISMLITDMPNKIDQLEQACHEIDLANIESIAHSIKGTALSMRCGILVDIAGKMENAAKDNSFEIVEVLLTELKAEWETVKNLLLQKIDH